MPLHLVNVLILGLGKLLKTPPQAAQVTRTTSAFAFVLMSASITSCKL
jgi:hypothetical protein